VLLPAWCVPGRADDAETIGVALLAAAQGRGHRPIAVMLGRPASTVRGWLRAARANADRARHFAAARQRRMEMVEASAEPAGTPLGDAVAALGDAAAAARRFFGLDRWDTSGWAYLVLLGGAMLLRPYRCASG
jgi:hypothetical protein